MQMGNQPLIHPVIQPQEVLLSRGPKFTMCLKYPPGRPTQQQWKRFVADFPTSVKVVLFIHDNHSHPIVSYKGNPRTIPPGFIDGLEPLQYMLVWGRGQFFLSALLVSDLFCRRVEVRNQQGTQEELSSPKLTST